MRKNSETDFFSSALIPWYESHKRDLPWRLTNDPYRIWLSEVILQQTRVAQGLPYYLRILEKYPTVDELAKAPEIEILRSWQGLGYYSRARNMHKAAKEVMLSLNGEFPRDYTTLRTLSGIGEYTAAAIASFSSGEAVPALDGNAYRVLARVFGIFEPLGNARSFKKFKDLAERLIPRNDAARFNQALMEFGAVQCRPANPLCDKCIFERHCYAKENDIQRKLPVRAPKRLSRERHLNFLLLERADGAIAMKKRTEKDIWHNMFSLPSFDGQAESPKEIEDGFFRKCIEQGSLVSDAVRRRHILTHQKLLVAFWRIKLVKDTQIALPDGVAFYTKPALAVLPKPVLIDKYLNDYYL